MHARVLITGAGGFIGQHLARRLAEEGAHVYAGVVPGRSPAHIAALPQTAQVMTCDVRDLEAVRAAVADSAPEFVFHLAAVGVTDPSVEPPLALAVNVGGTLHLLETLRACRSLRRVVLVGSSYEYGAREAPEGLDPFNIYAASKVAAWALGRAYWREHGLPVVTVRPFQVYGPGQPFCALIPSAIRAALSGADFQMTPGDQERDFIYVDDLVEGLLAAARARDIEGQSLDLGTGQVHKVRRVVEHIWALTGAPGRILAGALPYRPATVMSLAADAERTAWLTGWRARTKLYEVGLPRTIAWVEGVLEGERSSAIAS
ncbi:MAG: NAD(P)-dependent oxidoreductase [Anaerolineae bacterium]|nr:NAD(P)-dependent oxidoreductase [Anaerolineae bacterium]